MSYRLVFAADAQADWGRLSVDVQEVILDELDRLADAPPSAPAAVEVSYRLIVESAGVRHGLVLTLGVNHSTATITVLGIDKFAE